jgi:hypothetical protein
MDIKNGTDHPAVFAFDFGKGMVRLLIAAADPFLTDGFAWSGHYQGLTWDT